MAARATERSLHWPKSIKAKGEVRTQFHHVIDVAPTILEAAGLPNWFLFYGVQQRPIEGVSMLYAFNDARAPERRETQYFEMAGNRGIYHKGWTAVTRHRTPWETGQVKLPAFDDDNWELYDTTTDWTQSKNLAKEHPDKLHALQRLRRSKRSSTTSCPSTTGSPSAPTPTSLAGRS